MENRDTALLQLRPSIPSARLHPEMGNDEFFQNNTLRPVTKLQNDLLVAAFR
ncbi:MAG: glyoxalase, partial [Flavobacteriaceae bacterium]|nr:glyoxalase [Flavobacteriaceae bacterium]